MEPATSPIVDVLPPAVVPESLAARVLALAPAPGSHATPWDGLVCHHSVGTRAPRPVVYTPSLCVVAQGAKRAILGERRFRYDEASYLVVGAPMPLRAEVLEASEARPFLSLVLPLDVAVVHELLVAMGEEWHDDAAAHPGPSDDALWTATTLPLRVTRLDDAVDGALCRFLTALLDPADRQVLAPAAYREIVYLLLGRPQGDLIRLAARRATGVRGRGVARAIHYLHRHLDDRIDVPTVARAVGMSTSALHHAFKDATTFSPIQYLKQIRLHEARRLMLDDGCQAAEAASRVGYASPSQFSREFRRLFGEPPARYVRLYAQGEPTDA